MQERLIVALHAPALAELTADEQCLVDELVERPGNWGFERFACGGDPAGWRGFPMLGFQPVEGTDIESAMLKWGDGRESSSVVLPAHGSLVARLRTARQHQQDACRDARGALAAGAHMIVTTDRDPLSLRDEDTLRDCNVVTPLEMAVLMGIWSTGWRSRTSATRSMARSRPTTTASGCSTAATGRTCATSTRTSASGSRTSSTASNRRTRTPSAASSATSPGATRTSCPSTRSSTSSRPSTSSTCGRRASATISWAPPTSTSSSSSPTRPARRRASSSPRARSFAF